MRRHVLDGRAPDLIEALPQAVYVALAPFVGPAAAIDLIEAKVAAGVGSPRSDPRRLPA